MRAGVGPSKVTHVKYLFEQGCTIEEVSQRLQICQEGLVDYAPKPKKKVVKKRVVKKNGTKSDTDM